MNRSRELWIWVDSSRILFVRGGISQAHREFPGKSESTNLSPEILGMEAGRTRGARCVLEAELRTVDGIDAPQSRECLGHRKC